MNQDLVSQFQDEMIGLYGSIGKLTGYWANRFLPKVRKGGLQAAIDWLQPNSKPTKGLIRLAKLNQLEMSFEALVLREPWTQLFTEEQLSVARRNLNMVGGGILPEETKLLEGDKMQIYVNRYERNAEARQKCLEFHGTSCTVCKVDLATVYGAIAKGFIHVHHVTPLASIGKEYEINPMTDLKPVCPNCHAIIHLGGITRSIDEVKGMLKGG